MTIRNILITLFLYISSIVIIIIIDMLLYGLTEYLEIKDKRYENFINYCKYEFMLNLWISYLRVQMVFLPILFIISIISINSNENTELIIIYSGLLTVFAYRSYNNILYIDKSGFNQNILYMICSAIVYSYVATYNTTYMPTTSIIISIILLHLSFIISFIRKKYYFKK